MCRQAMQSMDWQEKRKSNGEDEHETSERNKTKTLFQWGFTFTECDRKKWKGGLRGSKETVTVYQQVYDKARIV